VLSFATVKGLRAGDNPARWRGHLDKLLAIARNLGRHRSTISRELKRNSARYDGRYRPSIAVERTNGRRTRSRKKSQFSPAQWRQVHELLREDWSPEQISGTSPRGAHVVDQSRNDLSARASRSLARRAVVQTPALLKEAAPEDLSKSRFARAIAG
jgi:hypothetical protein